MISTPGRRYAKLVNAMGESLGHSYGWQSEVARRLGITRSFVSRIAAGARSKARAETIDRAIDCTGVSRAFFYGQTEPTPEEYAEAATCERGTPLERGVKRRSEAPKLGELAARAARLLNRVEDQSRIDERAVAELLEIAQSVLDQPLPQCARAVLESPEGEARWTAFQILCGSLYRATLRQSGDENLT